MSPIRWHKLYIPLVAFDAAVILVGIWLHHETMSACGELLQHTATLDARQREIAALSQALNEYSLPLFRHGDRDTSPEAIMGARRFADTVGARKARTLLDSRRMRKFWEQVGQMSILHQTLDSSTPAASLTEADTEAAREAFEAARVGALRILSGEQESLLSRSAKHHLEYVQILKRQALVERLLAASLVATLAIMIWYTRRLVRADQELGEAQARVVRERNERLAAIGEVCTGVAHGIQNPLAAMSGSIELMLDLGQMDEDSRRRAEDSLSECRRLSQRVRRMLTFARHPTADRSAIELAAIVRGVVAEMSSGFQEKGVRVDVDIDNRPVVVRADEEEIASILIELLSNALAHAPTCGAIGIQLRRTAEHAEIRVSDNGPGVAQETSGHIFDLFYTTRSGGTGVGLAWARRVAEFVGGSLELSPDSTAGATFRAVLPLAQDSVVIPETKKTRASALRLAQPTGEPA